MERPDWTAAPGARDEMVVATPERVAFEYQVAGLGSRFLAQTIDVLVLLASLVLVGLLIIAIAVSTGQGQLAALVWVLLSFAVFFGYFPVFEGFWSGQTLGKRALRLRVVGERGEPVSVPQVVIRNLVRIVDFLPVWYGIGVITLFANGRGKRLGDIAAGTVVVRDHDVVRLGDLARRAETTAAAPEPAARRSIWADAEAPATLAEPAATAHPCAAAARRLPPELRRFVKAYASRRMELPWERRQWLADRVAEPLNALVSRQVAASGTLGALDCLADAIHLEEAAARG